MSAMPRSIKELLEQADELAARFEAHQPGDVLRPGLDAELRPSGRRTPVPTQVERHDVVVQRQQLGDTVPHVQRAAEPVDEDEGRAVRGAAERDEVAAPVGAEAQREDAAALALALDDRARRPLRPGMLLPSCEPTPRPRAAALLRRVARRARTRSRRARPSCTWNSPTA